MITTILCMVAALVIFTCVLPILGWVALMTIGALLEAYGNKRE